MQTASYLHPFSYCSYRRSSVKPDGWNKLQVPFPSKLAGKVVLIGRPQRCKILRSLKETRLCAIPNTDDGHPSVSVLEDSSTNHAPTSEVVTLFSKWSPPKYMWRGLSALIRAGQVICGWLLTELSVARFFFSLSVCIYVLRL